MMKIYLHDGSFKKWLEEHGMDQKSIAVETGLSTQTINNMVNGNRSPHPANIRMVADILGLEYGKENGHWYFETPDEDLPEPVHELIQIAKHLRASQIQLIIEIAKSILGGENTNWKGRN